VFGGVPHETSFVHFFEAEQLPHDVVEIRKKEYGGDVSERGDSTKLFHITYRNTPGSYDGGSGDFSLRLWVHSL
jgi:hypothetical protein